MDPNNPENQSSSVEPQSIRRRVVRYITGAGNIFRGHNRVEVVDNRPQWIIEDREPNVYERINTNAEMMRIEDEQRDLMRYEQSLKDSSRNKLLRSLRKGDSGLQFDNIPVDILNKVRGYVPRREKVETVFELNDRLDWDYINNREPISLDAILNSESSSETNE